MAADADSREGERYAELTGHRLGSAARRMYQIRCQLAAWLASFYVGYALLIWPTAYGIGTAFTSVGPALWTGQSLMPAINALLLGSLMYRSRLVPRVIPVIGLLGAPLLIAAVFAMLFGGVGQVSSVAALAALPVAAWELSLGVWLVVKGFRPSPITAGMAAATMPTAHQDVAV